MTGGASPDRGAIDVHAHVALPGVEGRAGALGPTSGRHHDGRPWFQVGDHRLDGVAYEGTPFADLDLRLEAMDRLGIARQVLSPNPLLLLAHSDPGLAADYARWHNDALAEVVAGAPHRVAALAQVPVQDPPTAAAELRRAVTERDHVGLALGTDADLDLDDPALDVLWAEAAALRVPVFVHPAPHGIDAPSPDARLARFGLDLSLGFLLEETLAVAQLVLGGVLDRHPRLEVCLSHGGGATAWLAPRLRRMAVHRREEDDLDAGLARLWWDTHVGGGPSLELLIATVGTDHLVLGTNLAGWDSPGRLDDEIPPTCSPPSPPTPSDCWPTARDRRRSGPGASAVDDQRKGLGRAVVHDAGQAVLAEVGPARPRHRQVIRVEGEGQRRCGDALPRTHALLAVDPHPKAHQGTSYCTAERDATMGEMCSAMTAWWAGWSR